MSPPSSVSVSLSTVSGRANSRGSRVSVTPLDVHEALAAHFPPATVVGINLLVGYDVTTAKFLGAMEVETEGPFVGWQLGA